MAPVKAPVSSQKRSCPPQGDGAALQQFRDRMEGDIGRTDQEIDPGAAGQLLFQLSDQFQRLGNGLVHLPVGGDQRLAHILLPVAISGKLKNILKMDR